MGRGRGRRLGCYTQGGALLTNINPEPITYEFRSLLWQCPRCGQDVSSVDVESFRSRVAEHQRRHQEEDQR